MERQVTIEDSLDERSDGAIEEVKEALLDYLKENPDTDKLPCLNNDLDYSGRVHEIIDGSVPVYTHEIKSTWLLHGPALEEAYENAGVGDNPMENDGMAAIYYYVSDRVNEWYNDNAQEVFDEWRAAQDIIDAQGDKAQGG